MNLALCVVEGVEGKDVGVDGSREFADVFKVDFVGHRHRGIGVGFGDERRDYTQSFARLDAGGDGTVLEPSGIVNRCSEPLGLAKRIELGILAHPELEHAVFNLGVGRVELRDPVDAVGVAVPVLGHAQLCRVVKGFGIGDAGLPRVAGARVRGCRVAARSTKESSSVAITLLNVRAKSLGSKGAEWGRKVGGGSSQDRSNGHRQVTW